MEWSTESGRAPPPWFGAIFIGVGLLIAGVGTGWVPTDPSSVHAPGWVLQMVGLFFALAGTSFYTRHLHPAVNGVVGVVLLSAFASVFSWVAFGAGTRHFEGGGSEASGRFFFGAFAIVVWLVVAMLVIRLIRTMLEPTSD